MKEMPSREEIKEAVEQSKKVADWELLNKWLQDLIKLAEAFVSDEIGDRAIIKKEIQTYVRGVKNKIRQLVIEDVPHKYQDRLLDELK